MGVEFEIENGVTRPTFGGFKENEKDRFVWQTIQNFIPSKFNLYSRGKKNNEDKICIGGQGFEESVQHHFFECSFSFSKYGRN